MRTGIAQLRQAKAWQAGYNVGRAGNEFASAPYLPSEFSKPLIHEWQRGHAIGLMQYRFDEKGKAAGGAS